MLSRQSDSTVYPSDTVTVATQTDLTTVVLSALEQDNRRMTADLAEMHVAKGYPSQEDLKGIETTLRFYTGLSSFTVLMALSDAVPEGRAAKPSRFDCFILTLMKLRLVIMTLASDFELVNQQFVEHL